MREIKTIHDCPGLKIRPGCDCQPREITHGYVVYDLLCCRRWLDQQAAKPNMTLAWNRAVAYARALTAATGFTHFIGYDVNGDLSVQGLHWPGAEARVTSQSTSRVGDRLPDTKDWQSEFGSLPEAEMR